MGIQISQLVAKNKFLRITNDYLRVLRRKYIFLTLKKLGLKLLTRSEILKSPEKYHVQYFGSEEVITVTDSGEIPENIKNQFPSFTAVFTKPFVCEFANAELAGPFAVGFDEDGRIIMETTTPIFAQDYQLELSVPSRTLIQKTLSSSKTPQIDIGCSLAHPWGKNYSHWMFDCLLRIEGLEFYQKQTGLKPTLIIDSEPTSWQIESLQLLGYGPDDYICWNQAKLQVKKLVVPAFRRYDHKLYKLYHIESISACKWLRERMLRNISGAESELSFSSKIYISRRKTWSRRVINEDEVIAALAPFGFVMYTLEDMSVLDKVRLFSQAEIVVAPTGAGTTHIIFSQNLTLIELFSPSLYNACFYSLARGLGFQYGCLKCDSPLTDVHGMGADIIVNVNELQQLVAKMQHKQAFNLE